MDEIEIAYRNLLKNRALTDNHHTPPAKYYLNAQYLWDSCFHAIIYAKAGDTKLAQDELSKLLQGQIVELGIWEGFIPNMQSFKKGERLIAPENWFRNNTIHSDYSQSPIIALAVKYIYEALGKDTDGGKDFLKKTYESLVKFYTYFRNNRENKDNHLIGVIHPSESGRDSDPTFDQWSWRLQINYRNINLLSKLIGIINTGLDYVAKLYMCDFKNRKTNWDPQALRKNFWVNDVMFNCLYVENLRILADFALELGKKEDSDKFNKWASETKNDMDRFMREKDKLYYAISRMGKVKQISISNLFGLILSDLGKDELIVILALLEDVNKFNTPYPIPSVAADDPKFDPHYLEKRLWRGPVWINTNWYLVTQGLLKQARIYAKKDKTLSKRCLEISQNIADKSLELVKKSKEREFYDPYNGKGYRVDGFGWSNLAYLLPLEIKESLESF